MGVSTLDCLRALLTGQPVAMAWDAFSDDDWQQLVAAAHTHGVAPLLFAALERRGWPEQIPIHVYQALQTALDQNTARNTLMYHEFARILMALRGIPVVVLKGAVLANTLYPHIGLRPMVDIDLFIAQEHLVQAAAVLQPLGYRKLAVQHDLVLYDMAQKNVDVELHWILAPSRGDHQADLHAWFWEQTEPWSLPQTVQQPGHASLAQVYQFTPTAQVLALVAHLAVHHGYTTERLIWMYDIHLLLTQAHDRVRWDDLLAQARLLGWDRALALVCQTLRDDFATPIPTDVLQELDRGGQSGALDLAYPRTGRPGKRDAGVWAALRVLRWPLRLRMMPLLVFPSPLYMQRRYRLHKPWMYPLYYPYRWVDVLGGSIRTLAARVRRERMG